jgi:hypothetical protein
MKKLFYTTTLWITIAISSFFSVAPAFAATTTPAPTPVAAKGTGGQALEIAPPVITLNANPGQSVKVQIFLRNISSGNLVVTGQANDFIAAGEDGTPKILLKDEGNDPYSLKNWVAPLPGLTIIPREIKTMTATINVPANASPGGHYGVIRFTATPADINTTGVSLSASLGSLVLVTVSGKISEDLTVQEFSVSHNNKRGSFFESGPVKFTERLKNTGNVHLQPTGQVDITNMFGKKLASVNVNVPPRNVLPQSIRRFEQPLDKSVIGNKKLFGHYTAKLNLTYGNNKKALVASVSFWVIPFRLIFIIALLLVGGFFLLRYLLKVYNRRIIERSRNSRPPQPPAQPEA